MRITLFNSVASGLFPFVWDKDQYKLSRIKYFISCVHVAVFIFVNVKLMYHDVKEYSAPVIYNHVIGIVGQFILRFLGVVITLVLFGSPLFNTNCIAKFLNIIATSLKQADKGIVKERIFYRKILLFSIVLTFVFIAMMGWTLFDGIVYYRKVEKTCPTLEYFFVVIMANFYKYSGLMNLIGSTYILYIMMQFLNETFHENVELKLRNE